jgi:hypothetical protein
VWAVTNRDQLFYFHFVMTQIITLLAVIMVIFGLWFSRICKGEACMAAIIFEFGLAWIIAEVISEKLD